MKPLKPVTPRKPRDWMLIVTAIGTAITFIGTGVSIWMSVKAQNVSQSAVEVSQRALDVSQKAEDRASGKLKAKFESYGIFNTDQKRLPEGVKKEKVRGHDVFTIKDMQNFMEWGPTIKIKNTGEYPIDSIRVEVAWQIGGMAGQDVKQIWPMPILNIGVSVLEPMPFGKLEAGHSVLIPVMKPLLQQMLKATLGNEFKDKEHVGTFRVDVYCRIVGATAFDQPEVNLNRHINLDWLPSHFPEDKSKLILDYEPRVIPVSQ